MPATVSLAGPASVLLPACARNAPAGDDRSRGEPARAGSSAGRRKPRGDTRRPATSTLRARTPQTGRRCLSPSQPPRFTARQPRMQYIFPAIATCPGTRARKYIVAESHRVHSHSPAPEV